MSIPPPSVGLTVQAMHLRAVIKSMKPKRRARYMAELAEAMAFFEDASNVVRIRGRQHDEALTLTRLEAVAWTRATLASFAHMDALGK